MTCIECGEPETHMIGQDEYCHTCIYFGMRELKYDPVCDECLEWAEQYYHIDGTNKTTCRACTEDQLRIEGD